MTVNQINLFAVKHGFHLTYARDHSGCYVVRSIGRREPAFIGSQRECYVWILGSLGNSGARGGEAA